MLGDGEEIFSNILFVYTNNNSSPTLKILNSANISNEIILTGIKLSDYKTGEINVIDVLGRKYATTVLNNNTIGVNSLKAGVYYLKIGSNEPLSFMV